MNNRSTLGLAVGAGYLLGRTKKLKLAIAVGTVVAGKKLQLSPKAVLDLARTQLENNPQFKEIGGQLREDFRGVGRAATGAILERQMEGLAGKLHSSTAGVRDRLAGAAPGTDDIEDTADKATGGLSGKATARASKSSEKSKGAEKSKGQEKGESREDGDRSQDTERPASRKRAPAKKSAPSDEREPAPRKRTQSATGTAKKSASASARKSTGAARRAPRSGAKGERGNG
ncbi:DNA primase [Streptomyces sp. NPDC046853]|uniref:DNA primase n=1 Tax=Streptomyces sp. NPDC046853 TaxID=3154920 RepID=UPI0033F410DC